MDAIDAILTRRSCRKYTEDPVAPEHVEQLLRAGMTSPTACNQRPWHFVTVDDHETLCKISDLHGYAPMLKSAPLGIVVCSDGGDAAMGGPYWPQDCAAATQNILLTAHALGLGAVWLGVYPDDERVAALRELLGMPESITPFCVISVGHPAKPVRPIERYESDRIHRDRW